MIPKVFVQGPAFSVGSTHPLERLVATEGLSDVAVADLKMRGVRVFSERTRSVVEMCGDSVKKSLAKAKLRAGDIGGIVFTNDMPPVDRKQECELLEYLMCLGIRTGTLIALQFLHCSGFSAAVETAVDLIRWKSKDNILVLMYGYVPHGGKRLERESGTVFGDGAASCIVSSRPWGFEFVAAETQTDSTFFLPKFPKALHDRQPARSLQAFQNLRSIAKGVLLKANARTEEITFLVGTYLNDVVLKLAACAVEVGPDKLLREPLELYGHVAGCDNLIGLASDMEVTGDSRGLYVMTIGWSPYVIGVAVLKMPINESATN